MSDKIDQCDSLYVWGNNASNELGLPDDAQLDNGCMTKPDKNISFDNLCNQVAPGNVSTLFLCANIDTKDTFLVTCGINFTLNEAF